MDTACVEGRYVPMAVRREIYERQGRRCAIPMCEHTLFLELAHVVPHASGGSREADNLILLCSSHHIMFDLGSFTLSGTAAQPVFLLKDGRDYGKRYEPGGDCSSQPGPAPPGAALSSRGPPPEHEPRSPLPASPSVPPQASPAPP
jgi:hypothetical protein